MPTALMYKKILKSVVLSALVPVMLTGCSENPLFFAGRYTGSGDPSGLYLFEMNRRNGDIRQVTEFNAGPNPSFFCLNRERKIGYLINEVNEYRGEKGGGLSTFIYNPGKGIVVLAGEMLIPFGGPCYVSLTPDEDYLLIANYQNASVLAVRLDEEKIPEVISDTVLYQPGDSTLSHAHMISYDPRGEFIYVTDLGTDRILTYYFNGDSGRFDLINNGIAYLPDKSGPRHFIFNAEGTRMYVINELASTLSVFSREENGELRLLQTCSTLPDDFKGTSYCAEICISDDGRFIYGSNRGHNSIVIFSAGIDGLLTLSGFVPCGGDWPRYFTTDPSGRYLLVGNQRSGDISVFRVNRRTGMLKGPVSKVNIPDVACMVFL